MQSATYPNFVGDHVVIAVALRFVMVNGDVSPDRLDDPQQRLTSFGVAARLHCGRIHLVEEFVALLLYDDLSLMRRPFLGFVAEIEPERREENESQDDCDHYIVVDAAARIRPPEMALEGLSKLAHGCIKCREMASGAQGRLCLRRHWAIR